MEAGLTAPGLTALIVFRMAALQGWSRYIPFTKRACGAGTYGTVLLCEDKVTGERVAVKCSPTGSSALSEYLVTSALMPHGCPNLLQVLHCFTSEDKMHLVFKYMQTNLHALTVARAGCWFSWAEADCIIRQIAAGIRHLHHFGLPHGDLSDNNILLSGSTPSDCQAGLTAGWEVRVADYASAFTLTDLFDSFSPGVHITTPSFEAPEMLLGLSPTTAVDHFALGVHCVTLACGQRAVFDRATPRRIPDEVKYPEKSTPSRKTSRTNARAFFGRLVCLGVPCESWPGWADTPLADELRPLVDTCNNWSPFSFLDDGNIVRYSLAHSCELKAMISEMLDWDPVRRAPCPSGLTPLSGKLVAPLPSQNDATTTQVQAGTTVASRVEPVVPPTEEGGPTRKRIKLKSSCIQGLELKFSPVSRLAG